MALGLLMAAPTKLDRAGEDFIAVHEGEVLYLYDDTNKFATFGIGHLVARKPVSQLSATTHRKYGTKAKPLPHAKAKALSREIFKRDVAKHVNAVLTFVPERWRDTPGRLTVFTSMSFNLGTGILTPAPPLTTLGEMLKGPRTVMQREKIANAILLYDKDGFKRLPGLTRRRRDERDLFLRSWK